MSTKLWASSVSTAKYGVNGITLHTSREAALRGVAEYLQIGHEQDPEYSDEKLEALSEDDLYEWIMEHADDDGTDWNVEQAELPSKQTDDRREEIRLAVCDLRDAQERLRLAGAPYARLAVVRARKSVEGALRHADRGLPASTRKVRRQRKHSTNEAHKIELIYAVLWDEETNEWAELNSCADAIQDICLILGSRSR